MMSALLLLGFGDTTALLVTLGFALETGAIAGSAEALATASGTLTDVTVTFILNNTEVWHTPENQALWHTPENQAVWHLH